MKNLYFCYGYINIDSNSCLDIIWEMDSPDKYSCRLYSDRKVLYLFSFQDERDAKDFCLFFYRNIKEWLESSKEFVHLNEIIQQSLEKIEEKENATCRA